MGRMSTVYKISHHSPLSIYCVYSTIYSKVYISTSKLRNFSATFFGRIFPIIMSKHKLESSATSDESAAKKGHWALGLLDSMKDPKLRVEEDDKVVVIKDKFPKAEFHYLILPKDDIPGILSLGKEHESLLEHMETVGNILTDKHRPREFNIGYHAVPNMQRLHLHVISTDFNSSCLKTKLHWNSFTSQFFRPSRDVRDELRENGKIKKMSCEKCDEYLKQPLKCHKCSVTPKNMPALKKHILSHMSVDTD